MTKAQISRPSEPAWLVEARLHIGLREIPGPRHNRTILDWIKRLGGWFTDDETPWCGTFVAHCLDAAKVTPRPKHWYRALAWGDWGKASQPVIGAIAVFGRSGGGHVGFVVGESATHYYVLGGNQNNMVRIDPIAKGRLVDLRWPESVPLLLTPLPLMTGGAVSRNEA